MNLVKRLIEAEREKAASRLESPTCSALALRLRSGLSGRPLSSAFADIGVYRPSVFTPRSPSYVTTPSPEIVSEY